jgi:hypothetical protein
MTEPILFSVAQLGRFPALRSLGRDGRNRLDDMLNQQQHVDLTIDFAGVNAMTYSFTDEFLGKFLTTVDPAEQDLTIKVTGLNAENAEAVSVCVERRETQVVILKADGTLTLVGDPILGGTFDAARNLADFKANDLADALSLSPQNANNRLKRLVACGALRRGRTTGTTRGGKEFSYSPVPAQIPDAQELATA